jgi:hypothetical protein
MLPQVSNPEITRIRPTRMLIRKEMFQMLSAERRLGCLSIKGGCPGSLTSCPGPETTAAAAMCDSG